MQDGDDLHLRVHITLLEALLGVDKTVAHLDKHQVRIKKDGITRPGKWGHLELALCWGCGGDMQQVFQAGSSLIVMCLWDYLWLSEGVVSMHRGSHDHS